MSITNVSKPSTSLTNTTRPTQGETWGSIQTTWATETETWVGSAQLIENTVKPTPDSTTVVDSCIGSDFTKYIGKSTKGTSQSFTGNGGVLNSCSFKIAKLNSPVGTVYARIYAHSGTFGTSSEPTGVALAVSDGLDVSEISTNLSYVRFTFSGANKITLTNSTYYVVTLEWTGNPTSTDGIYARYNSSGATHPGNEAILIGASWFAVTTDLNFFVYTDSPTTGGITNFNKP